MQETLFVCPRLMSDGEKSCHVIDGMRVVVLRSEGQYVAFEARCPHRGMDLYQWGVALPDSKIMCSSHGYVFDMKSGENLKARGDEPLVAPLQTFEVVERDDGLHVLRRQSSVGSAENSRALAG